MSNSRLHRATRTAVKWYGKVLVAVFSAILLIQISEGWFGWLWNLMLVFVIALGAFIAGWFDADPPDVGGSSA